MESIIILARQIATRTVRQGDSGAAYEAECFSAPSKMVVHQTY
jgi:hypothetical protein